MTTYAIAPGSTLVLSVDGGDWQTVTFSDDDFDDPEAATTKEVAAVLDRADHVTAEPTDESHVTLATTSIGANATLEIDLQASTAAGALGLVRSAAEARGEGLVAPRLVSLAREPFALTSGAEMVVVRNGRRRKVSFSQGFTEGEASAADVVAALNAVTKGIARRTRDGRVMLVGTGLGPDAALEVQPPGPDGKADAAQALGFIGANAISHPHRSAPAALMLAPSVPTVAAVSLSAAPVELHLPGGVTELAPRQSLPLSAIEAADPHVQRLAEQGVLRLMPGDGGET